MARPPQSGLYDPYWYEATFAERFIVQMLNADSGIQSVTIQTPGVRGIDDVVVRYRAKPDAYYQIKHTRAGDTLSFADLTSVRGANSLIGTLAEGWAGVTRNGSTCETHLGTNREMTATSVVTAVPGRGITAGILLRELPDGLSRVAVRLAGRNLNDEMSARAPLLRAREFNVEISVAIAIFELDCHNVSLERYTERRIRSYHGSWRVLIHLLQRELVWGPQSAPFSSTVGDESSLLVAPQRVRSRR